MPATFIIFGASGDLTSRKLVPALYQLFRKKRLPNERRIVGFSRTHFSDDQWRASLRESTAEFSDGAFDEMAWAQFAKSIFYHPGDIGQENDFKSLADRLNDIEHTADGTRVYYLATAPQFYEQAVTQLGVTGLADETHGTRRLVVEKPFGT